MILSLLWKIIVKLFFTVNDSFCTVHIFFYTMLRLMIKLGRIWLRKALSVFLYLSLTKEIFQDCIIMHSLMCHFRDTLAVDIYFNMSFTWMTLKARI